MGEMRRDALVTCEQAARELGLPYSTVSTALRGLKAVELSNPRLYRVEDVRTEVEVLYHERMDRYLKKAWPWLEVIRRCEKWRK